MYLIIKKQREKNQINKIRKENGEITTDNTEMQKIIRDCRKQLYANKMEILEMKSTITEMKNSLEGLNRFELTRKKKKITELRDITRK